MSESDWSSHDDDDGDDDDVADAVASASGALNARLVHILSGAAAPSRSTRRRLSPQPPCDASSAATVSAAAVATTQPSTTMTAVYAPSSLDDKAQHTTTATTVTTTAAAAVAAPPHKRKRLHDLLVDALLQRTASDNDDDDGGHDGSSGDRYRKPDARVHELVVRIGQCIRASDDRAEAAAAVLRGLSDPLNGELRRAVLSGALSPQALVAMDDESLLNPRARAQWQAERHARQQQSTVEYWQRLQSTITHLYTCPSCGNKECYANFRSTDFVKWQGDDPTPTLLTCTQCKTSFRE